MSKFLVMLDTYEINIFLLGSNKRLSRIYTVEKEMSYQEAFEGELCTTSNIVRLLFL